MHMAAMDLGTDYCCIAGLFAGDTVPEVTLATVFLNTRLARSGVP